MLGLRVAVAGDPEVAQAVGDALTAVSLLQGPMRGYRKQMRERRRRGSPGRWECPEKISDEAIVRALRLCPSIKVAAARLRLDRTTVGRRITDLMRHPEHSAALRGLPSLRRSLAARVGHEET